MRSSTTSTPETSLAARGRGGTRTQPLEKVRAFLDTLSMTKKVEPGAFAEFERELHGAADGERFHQAWGARRGHVPDRRQRAGQRDCTQAHGFDTPTNVTMRAAPIRHISPGGAPAGAPIRVIRKKTGSR